MSQTCMDISGVVALVAFGYKSPIKIWEPLDPHLPCCRWPSAVGSYYGGCFWNTMRGPWTVAWFRLSCSSWAHPWCWWPSSSSGMRCEGHVCSLSFIAMWALCRPFAASFLGHRFSKIGAPCNCLTSLPLNNELLTLNFKTWPWSWMRPKFGWLTLSVSFRQRKVPPTSWVWRRRAIPWPPSLSPSRTERSWRCSGTWSLSGLWLMSDEPGCPELTWTGLMLTAPRMVNDETFDLFFLLSSLWPHRALKTQDHGLSKSGSVSSGGCSRFLSSKPFLKPGTLVFPDYWQFGIVPTIQLVCNQGICHWDLLDIFGFGAHHPYGSMFSRWRCTLHVERDCRVNAAPLLSLMSAQNTSDFPGLWSLLRNAGLQSLAPRLISCGVRSPEGIGAASESLLLAGVKQHELDALTARISSPGPLAVGPVVSRWDLTAPNRGPKASLQAAMQAAHPNNRQLSLEALDNSLLAPSTQPAVDSRVRTYCDLCHAWAVNPFPITFESLRCFAASLKAGRYKSATVYFHTIFGHQQRHFAIPVDQFLKGTAKSYARAIARGLGPSSLKDSFDMDDLNNIPTAAREEPFDITEVRHVRDVLIFASWWMLREIELAGARRSHLYRAVGPTSWFRSTRRTKLAPWLCDPCSVGAESAAMLCAQRVLDGEPHEQPFVPTALGAIPSKAEVIGMFRGCLSQAGVVVERPDESGRMLQRFGGHCARVSGAQYLSRKGVPLSTIQILGRWLSQAVERYVQQAPLVGLPAISSKVLNWSSRSGAELIDLISDDPVDGVVNLEDSASSPTADGLKKRRLAPPAAPDSRIVELETQVAALKASIVEPTQTPGESHHSPPGRDRWVCQHTRWVAHKMWLGLWIDQVLSPARDPAGIPTLQEVFPGKELEAAELESDGSECTSSSSSDNSSSSS